MHTTVPLSNWSLKKAIGSLPDSFSKAKFRIIYTILVFSIVKAAVVIFFSIYNDQNLQLIRASLGIVAYVTVIKFLLSYPNRIPVFAHIMLTAGLVLIWTNVLFFLHETNMPTLQFVFMVILSSFYTLGNRAGFVYSFISILPCVLNIFLPHGISVASNPQELASPGFEIIIAINFFTLVFVHYFFYKTFDQNIREKELLNTQLQLSVAEAKQLAKSKSDFLATMSHELRTPLNSVIGVTELLLQDTPAERHQEDLNILRYSASDLLSLINNILDINKLDSNKLQLEHTPFNLYQLVQNICSVLKIKARDKKLRLNLVVDDELKSMIVTSDPTRLSQVMYNLAGNAIKFTEAGEITITLQLVEQRSGKADVLFSVTDTGIGIAEERHPAIFESFAQAESNTTRKYGGTGLGLAIVKQVLALFNSSIQLESSLGKGSRFFFQLSFETTSVVTENANTSFETNDLNGLKILVAEDNAINKLVLEKQLRNLDITAVMVSDGKEAYEDWIDNEYDAVFLDLDMPEWDGYETVAKIRESLSLQKKPSYLIAFTASVSEQQHIISSGFDDYLYKPVDMQSLKKILEKVATHKKSFAV